MEEPEFGEKVKLLLEKLIFISRIPKNKKVNLGTMSFCEDNSFLTALKRTFMCESRKDIVGFVNSCIEEANTLLLATPSNSLIVEYLVNAQEGIQSLITTYRHDAHTVSKLEVSLKHINLIVSSYRKGGREKKTPGGIN